MLAPQNDDGGFAWSAAEASSIGATAAALRVLALGGGRLRDIAGCLRFVAACHDRAGGFASEPGGPIGVVSTAAGLVASVELDELPIFWREAGVGYFVRNVRSFDDVGIGAETLALLRTVSSAPRTWKDIALAGPPGAERIATLAHLGLAVPERERELTALVAREPSSLDDAYRVVRALHLLGEVERTPVGARDRLPETLQETFFALSIDRWLAGP